MAGPIFETYDQFGFLELTLSSRLTKFLGFISINTAVSGSITDPNLSQGTPWYCCLLLNQAYSTGGLPPQVTIQGNTVSWTQDVEGVNGVSATLIYGIYSNGSN